MSLSNEEYSVLIVDDNPDILRLLSWFLKSGGYQIQTAENGEQALQLIERQPPDLILLDVLMPGPDGFEVCHILKENPATRDIPVIFLTALTDTNNKIKGFEVGAVDYITKPSQSEEVVARVTTHLTLRKLQRDLQEQNQRLHDENQQRRRVQEALRESRERYRLLAENSTDMISQQTPDGVYQYVSPACRTLLGYTVDEMVGVQEVDFIHPDDRHLFSLTNGNISQRPAEMNTTYRVRRKDNSYIWVETTSRLVRDPKTHAPLEIISVSRDVTDRKTAEVELQRAHDELEQRVRERTAELEQVNEAFGRFVPHEFLKYLGKESITDVHLGDQVQRDMTILCSDIRSFSSLSETMSPQENFNFLNTYLSRVSPIVRTHSGFIDKYIGDAVMALFPDRVEDALQAAIGIRQEVSTFNQVRKKQGLEPVRCGTGIHIGSLMLGTIGEAERMESTVISDSVNLAFRLEGLTKLYGASIVISQDALYSISKPTTYNFRFLDRVTVKGKKEPVSVFEIFDGDPPDVMVLKQKTLTNFERGMLHYHSQEFIRAITYFNAVVAQDPTDKAAILYKTRAEYFVKNGVPPDWEGVASLTEK